MDSLPLIAAVRSAARKLIMLLAGANVAFIALTAIRGRPVWWIRFMGEHNMWTRGMALELLASSAVCALVYALCRYESASGGMPVFRPYLWLAMAIGFAYLAMDELFMIHENTERLFHVNDSFAIVGYVAIALALARALSADLRKARHAGTLFAFGVLVTGISVVFDEITHVRGPMMVLEEVFELSAAFWFLASFIAVLADTTCQVLADAFATSN